MACQSDYPACQCHVVRLTLGPSAQRLPPSFNGGATKVTGTPQRHAEGVADDVDYVRQPELMHGRLSLGEQETV